MELNKAMHRLEELDSEMVLIGHIGSVLGWDQEMVPPAGVEERARQTGWLESQFHRILVSDETGSLLHTLGADESNPEGSPELAQRQRALVRVLFTAWNRERKLDEAFVTEFAETTSRAHGIWVEARKADDFSLYAPTLEHIVELVKEKASRYGYVDDPYDPLIDRFEPGTTTAEVARVFAAMQADLIDVLEKLKDRPKPQDSFLYQKYPQDKLEAFSKEVLDAMGFDWQRGATGLATHPYTTTLGADDIRITTRYTEPNVTSSLYSTVHEGGHALYEQLSSNEITRGSSLAGGASLAFHESQSRLWENTVGRSKAFWIHFFPKFKALFPTQLDGVDVDRFVNAINRVEPTFIRVDADEVTYGLHIILRFQLERALLTGDLAVKDLPEAWNDAMERLLGIRPKRPRDGVLQDVHWSMGELGYFPTYALGNLYGAQIYAKMAGEIDLDAAISTGRLGVLKDWLAEHVYRYGSIYKPKDLLVKVTGQPLDTIWYAKYLNKKFLGGALS